MLLDRGNRRSKRCQRIPGYCRSEPRPEANMLEEAGEDVDPRLIGGRQATAPASTQAHSFLGAEAAGHGYRGADQREDDDKGDPAEAVSDDPDRR